MTGDTLPVGTDLVAAARKVLESNWRAEGYTVPNSSVYPFQWLWDSCFHAVVWSALGEPDRARSELRHLFRMQAPSGFVPHVDYESAPDHHASFWGRSHASSLTQPPMFGHALAMLAGAGAEPQDPPTDPPADLLDSARRGLLFLLRDRQRIEGLVPLCHPWESGGDDSPRWDHWCGSQWDRGTWVRRKGELVRSLIFTEDGSPVANREFRVASVGFNALVAFNARELASLGGDAELAEAADDLVQALDARWDAERRTWVDAGDSAQGSGQVRTLDALLPVLVTSDAAIRRQVFADLMDPAAYGGAFGPAGVHRSEPVFAPETYWRGPAWPQLTYLFWVAADRVGNADAAAALATMLRLGAERSGWSEYWSVDDGTGLGARPQSWAALAAVVTPRRAAATGTADVDAGV